MLQRFREIKENEEGGKVTRFNKLKANQESKERIKSQRVSGEEMETVSAKRDEMGWQIRHRVICSVLYRVGETSVNLEAREGMMALKDRRFEMWNNLEPFFSLLSHNSQRLTTYLHRGQRCTSDWF